MRLPALSALLLALATPTLTARSAAAEPIQSEDRARPDSSLYLAYGVDGLGLGLVILLLRDAMKRQRRMAKLAARSVTPDGAPLREGRAVLGGVVASEDGAPPVRIAIEQHGSESQTKHGWQHTWKETSREVEVRSFRLALPGGGSIPVEPGEDIFLVDHLDGGTRTGVMRRRRVAELSDGERAFVSGVLRSRSAGKGPATAYRGGGEGELVLVPPPRGKVFVSTEPLERRHLDRAGLHRAWAIAFAIFFAFSHLLFLTYHLRVAFGEQRTGRVFSKRHFTTRHKNSTTHHHEVTVDVVDGAHDLIKEEISSFEWNRVSEGQPLSVVVVPWSRSNAQLGERPSLHLAAFVTAVIGLFGMGLVYVIQTRSARPWYEKRRVVDTGSGRIS